jgi:phytoene synthase
MSAWTLNESYQVSIQIMQERATSFYEAFKHLPQERFHGVAAIYAFCRYSDDCVDYLDDENHALHKLDELEHNLKEFYLNKNLQSDYYPWWKAFVDTIQKFNIPIDAFLDQIEGQRRDLHFKDIATMDDLIEYSRLVAGSVGVMMLPVIAADGIDLNNHDFKKACESLGVGMQITNILRDVGEDMRLRNRLYLPLERLSQYGIDRKTIEYLSNSNDVEVPLSFKDCWESLSLEAKKYYSDFESWISSFHPMCQVSLVAAAYLYQGIEDVVRKENYNCFNKRCYTSLDDRKRLIEKAKQMVLAKQYNQ